MSTLQTQFLNKQIKKKQLHHLIYFIIESTNTTIKGYNKLYN
jgi:hypothetical protein